MLEIGSSLTLGIGLTDLLRAQAEAAPSARARARARTQSKAAGQGITPTADACILIFLNGGPSHLDMWDMKPDAAAEIRGEFKPIASSLPGIMVSEHLPRFARQVHLGTLIRSAHHSVNNAHGAAVYTSLTGHDRGEVGGRAKPTDNPAIGSVVGVQRPSETGIMPFVAMPYITAEGRGGPPQPGFFGGWLGRNHDPMFVLKDPNAADFTMSELSHPAGVDLSRFTRRRQLDAELGTPENAIQDARLRDADGFRAQAFDLLTAPTA